MASARDGLCVKTDAQPHLGTWDGKRDGWQSERTAAVAGSPELFSGTSLGMAVQVQRWNLHLIGVALGAASQSGDGTAPCPSGSCVSTLGLGVSVPLGVPCVLRAARSLCLQPETSTGHLRALRRGDTSAHRCLSARLFPAWSLHPKTPGTLPMHAGGAMPPCPRPGARPLPEPPLG